MKSLRWARSTGLAAWAISRPVTTGMSFLALGLLGVLSYRDLPVQLLPDFASPEVYVTVSHSGATPEAIEDDILRPLEGELATVGGIDEIRSRAGTGSGVITLSFERGVDVDFAALRLQQRLASARSRLPEEAFVDLRRNDTSDYSKIVMLASFRGDVDLEAMRTLADDTIIPLLTAIDGVVEVVPQGGASKQVGVFLDPDRAQGHGVSVGQVRDAMARASFPVTGVGEVSDGARRLPVVLDGRARRLSDVADAPVDPGGRVRLAHVADILPGIGASTESYRVNGKTSVGLWVFKDQQSNLIRVARRLRERIEAFNGEQEGSGFSLHVDFDAAEVIEEHLDLLLQRAATGALLALVVLLVFLRGIHPLAVLGLGLGAGGLAIAGHVQAALAVVLIVLALARSARPVLVVALAAPASLLIACDLFRWAGLTLNILTLLGLALSVGMLLDNAIVVLESIATRRQRGDPPIEAARTGATLVQRAVVAGTVTTIVVFAPLYVLDVELAPLWRELALAVTFPLLASLLVAVTLVPMAVSRLGTATAREEPVRLPGPCGVPRPERARTLYSVLLRATLRRPGLTMAGFFALVVLSVLFGGPLVVLFAEPPRPPDDRVELQADLPAGSTVAETDEIARVLESLAEDLPEVDEVQAAVRDELATVTIVFKDAEEREGSVNVERVRRRLREQAAQVEGAEVEVDPARESGGGGGADLLGTGEGTRELVRVIGAGGPELADVARRAFERLEQVPGIVGVRSDLGRSQPSIEIRPDRDRLAEFGLTTAELMGLVWATKREGSAALHPFRLGDEDVDLVLWVEGNDERTLEDLRRFPLYTSTGARVPLAAVARIATASQPPELRRWQRERTVTLTYGFAPEVTASAEATRAARADVDRAVATLAIPTGYHVEVEHEDEELSVGWKMFWLALALVFAVLAMTFESVVQPFLIVLCVPLAAVPGVIWALVLTGTGLNLFVLLGIVVLLGVVVNNGVLLVDRFQALLADGVRRTTAVMRAAHSRLRPVLMTTATTVIGMLPLAVDTGGQQEIWPPFARAVIGGLVASTLISLLLVPAGLLVFARLTDLLRTLGVPLVLACLAAASGLCGWLYWGRQLVVSNMWRVLLTVPLLLASFGLARALQRLVRGERAPELIGEGAVVLRARSARKVYGGPTRSGRELARVRRWKDLARAAGLTVPAIDPPSEGRRSASWQLLLLFLLGYLHALTETAWGLALLSAPTLALLDAFLRSTLQSLGRPGAWPPAGLAFRLWRATQAAGTWAYVYWRHRPGEPTDVVVLVILGAVCLTWGGFHLVREGGLFRLAAKGLAPEPVTALDGVDLSFEDGLYGLLGPNGAGKSTLMRLVVNVFRPTRGRVTVNGHEIAANAASLQPRIGYLPQFFGVPQRLTARQYLHHQALLAGKTDRAEREALVGGVLAEVGLADRADERLGGYSGGMRQRVGIARTLLNVPRIVVVDEPTVGLDPKERIRFRNLLAELAKSRIVLLSTHVVEDIGSSCREVIVLDGGTVVYRGTPADLARTADGQAWIADVSEPELGAFSKTYRVVSSTRSPEGVRVRGIGPSPPGATMARPTLEDAYLLLLGRSTEEGLHVA